MAAHLVDGRLMLALIPSSRKARDLARDARVCVQSPISDPDEPGDELKLHGRVVAVDQAAHLRWERGEMTLARWDARRGANGPERRRLGPTGYEKLA